MTGRMLLLTAGAALLSVHLWHAHQHTVAARELEEISDGQGFVPVQMPDNAPPDKVLILAPVHCSSDVAKRADALAQFLSDKGIPNVRSSVYSISRVTPDMIAGIQRAHSLSPPVVLVNGRGKSDPTGEEVLDEYRGDHP
jgi:hypothetical protein